jgi:IS1 family transposase
MRAVIEDQVPHSCRPVYSDARNMYSTLIYYEARDAALPDKSQTYIVEGSNAEIRHHLGR